MTKATTKPAAVTVTLRVLPSIWQNVCRYQRRMPRRSWSTSSAVLSITLNPVTV
jgi:hypothetical protein